MVVDSPAGGLQRREVICLQTVVCLLLAGTLLGGFGLVDMAARSDVINDWILARQVARWTRTNSKLRYNRGYVDFEGRLVYEEMRNADYSDGGVYFVGASTTVNSLLCWELPKAEQRLIHNYSLGAAGPTEWRKLLRFLVEDEGLLEAGGDKTLVVFGLYFGSFLRSGPAGKAGFVSNVFQRHGLFDLEGDELHRAKLFAFERWYLEEKARCSNFLHYLLGHMAFRANPPISEAQKQEYARLFREAGGDDYRDRMQQGLDEFAELVDYLRARNVNVAVYMCPLGSWFRGDEFPQSEVFHEKVSELCDRMEIGFTDFEVLLSDEDFFDHAHANYRGQIKIHPYLVNLAISHLERTGALPGGEAR